jgi:hypothetical protein
VSSGNYSYWTLNGERLRINGLVVGDSDQHNGLVGCGVYSYEDRERVGIKAESKRFLAAWLLRHTDYPLPEKLKEALKRIVAEHPAIQTEERTASMTPRDFCYWLQGAIELGGLSKERLNLTQMDTIVKHVSLVPAFNKPISALSKPEQLVLRLHTLNDCKADWGTGIVWETLIAQLSDAFEHHLDHEVPYNLDHLHETVRR